MKGLKQAVIQHLVPNGLGWLARRMTKALPRVIMYHGFCNGVSQNGRLSKSVFREQLIYLRKHFNPWLLSDLIEYYKAEGKYPERAVVVTVDDGYESFNSIAFPVLKEFSVPATVFVVADAVDKKNWLWPDILNYAFENGTDEKDEEHWGEYSRLMAHCKTLRPPQRGELLKGILAERRIDLPPEPVGPFKLIPWQSLRELSATGLVEVGSHSCTHPIMSSLHRDESEYEIFESKRIISDRLQKDVTSFCYPNGQPGDYTVEQKETLKNAGYLVGIASHNGLVNSDSDLYALPRISTSLTDLTFSRVGFDGVYHLYRKGG